MFNKLQCSSNSLPSVMEDCKPFLKGVGPNRAGGAFFNKFPSTLLPLPPASLFDCLGCLQEDRLILALKDEFSLSG